MRKHRTRKYSVKSYRGRRPQKRYKGIRDTYKGIIAIIIIFLGIYYYNHLVSLNLPIDQLADFKISDSTLWYIINYSDIHEEDPYENLGNFMMHEDFDALEYNFSHVDNYLKKHSKMFFKNVKYPNQVAINAFYKNILEEIKYFPVLSDEEFYYYDNSWKAERTYGGDRQHLGTDIMDKNNCDGSLKIISMTDGIIQNIGWNELGGWRIGIKTEEGIYFYYAHLNSYEPNLEKGTKIKAGMPLGYMGCSGYGKEGTVGKFAVHLHLGILFGEVDEKEVWVNPYHILKYAEKLN